jgi:PhnB protein
MELNPYLSFDGQCETAFKFYERCLGGKIVAMMTYADTPMATQMPPEWHGKIIHACLNAGGRVLMGGDSPPDRHDTPTGFSVNVGVDSPAEAERIFAALGENGTVRMPLGETFWAHRFGMLVDQFGTPWMVNCLKTA